MFNEYINTNNTAQTIGPLWLRECVRTFGPHWCDTAELGDAAEQLMLFLCGDGQ